MVNLLGIAAICMAILGNQNAMWIMLGCGLIVNLLVSSAIRAAVKERGKRR